ncbi:MAG TPA: hypothetical protein VFX60_19130 [Micromonospora sp.]|nr:hypothetical protein [Micromonospora sp.]
MTRPDPPRRPGWPRCARCEWPLNPAAAAGGHTTRPGCDPDADPRPLATVTQLRPRTHQGDQ